MDEDKKEIKKEDKEVEAKETDEKPKKKTAEDVEREMEQMLNDLSEQMGVDKNQIKVVSFRVPKRNFKIILFESLYIIIANCLLLMGLSGYIKWCDCVWYDLVFFGLTFSGLEIILRNLFHIIFKKTIVQSFGLILILPPLLAAVICVFLPFIITPDYIFRYIVVVVILLIVREFIKKYSIDFYHKHKYKRSKKIKK